MRFFWLSINCGATLKPGRYDEVELDESNLGSDLNSNDSSTTEIIQRLRDGGVDEAESLFAQFYDRLHVMVSLRLDARVRPRVDPEDVLQETYLEFVKSLPLYLANPQTTPYLWLRAITARHLNVIHRRHLKVQSRAVGREISLFGAVPQVSSIGLASQLLGRFSTPSQKVMRMELQLRVQNALNSLLDIDREILALRHFEMMTNGEVAQVLELSEAAASNRYVLRT